MSSPRYPPPAMGEKFCPKHEIFILDADLESELDPNRAMPITSSLVNDLLHELDMHRLEKLEIFPAADARAPGWSFIQPITTSHISGHYFSRPGIFPHIHLDIYSCKAFDWEKAITTLNEHLSFRDWSASLIVRGWSKEDRIYTDIRGLGANVLAVKELNTDKAAVNLS